MAAANFVGPVHTIRHTCDIFPLSEHGCFAQNPLPLYSQSFAKNAPLQCLKGDFLGIVQTRPLDPLQLLHELALQGIVVRLGPRPVLLERLGDAHLEIQAPPAHTWRVTWAPRSAMSWGRYSARRDWQALSDSESPGPPEGPGVYCEKWKKGYFSMAWVAADFV